MDIKWEEWGWGGGRGQVKRREDGRGEREEEQVGGRLSQKKGKSGDKDLRSKTLPKGKAHNGHIIPPQHPSINQLTAVSNQLKIKLTNDQNCTNVLHKYVSLASHSSC